MTTCKTCWSRREFLFRSGGGVSGVALAYLLNQDNLLAAQASTASACNAQAVGFNPFAPKSPHFTPRAKAVISLFMSGGVSHVDTFDPKPALTKYAGQPLDGKVAGDVIVRQGHPGPLMPSPFAFKKYGQSGIDVSEIFPNIGNHVDEIAFIRSVYGQSNDHVQATYEMQMGQTRMGFPSVGSWVTYGLGSESSSLPAYVVIHDARGGPIGGVNDWSSGFLPASYQGTLFRATGDPIVDLRPPSSVNPEQQRARLDLLAKLNELDMQQRPENADLAARISSYELAFRMQGCAPEALDVTKESEATRKLYGLDDKLTEPFGRQCLMARRLVEHGVRFVQLFHGGMGKVEPRAACGRIRSSDCWTPDRLESARVARVDAPDLARRIRPHADLAARRRTRSQPRRAHRVDGRGGYQRWPGDWINRRFRLQGRRATRVVPRSPRDDAASARARSYEAHVQVQWPQHALDGCVRHLDSADYRVVPCARRRIDPP
jgi:hypothetical protein